MTDDRRNKSSEDLLREARESLAPTYRETPEPERPPIVRPSDRIQRSEPSPIPAAPAPRRETTPEPVRREPVRSPSPSTTTSTAGEARTTVRTVGRVTRTIGTLFLIGAVLLGGLFVFGLLSGEADADDVLIGGTVILLVPVAIGIALLAVARRMREAANDPSMQLATLGASSSTAPIGASTTRSGSERTHLHPGELVLASVKGTHPSVKNLAKVAQIAVGILLFFVFAAFADGLPLLVFAVAGGAVIGRALQRALGRARLGSGTPVSMRITVTDRRVLVAGTNFTGTAEHAFLDRSVDMVERFDVAKGEPSVVTIGFTSGDDVAIAVSKKDARKLARAIREAGPIEGMPTDESEF